MQKRTLGQKGLDVSAIGFGCMGLEAVYGPETEEAVRSFQSSRGLTVDGIVGPATIAALRSHAVASSAGPSGSIVTLTGGPVQT